MMFSKECQTFETCLKSPARSIGRIYIYIIIFCLMIPQLCHGSPTQIRNHLYKPTAYTVCTPVRLYHTDTHTRTRICVYVYIYIYYHHEEHALPAKQTVLHTFCLAVVGGRRMPCWHGRSFAEESAQNFPALDLKIMQPMGCLYQRKPFECSP